MRTNFITCLLFAIGFLMVGHDSQAQSAVYIYKNPNTGEGDYMFMYSMPSVADAEFMAQEKLIELGYAEELVRKQASSGKKGYGMIIKSEVSNKYGRKFIVFGASVGCKTKEQAVREALQNLKEFNPEWDGEEHEEVFKFLDQ